MRRGVALGGFAGTGKSTVGGALAARTGLPLIDVDEVLVARFGSIASQFADDGEAVFRARERALVAEVAAGATAVVATGGGTWIDPENRRLLRGFGWCVVLWASLPELLRRVGTTDATRPLWDDRVAERLATRTSAYEDADLRVDTDGRAVDDVAEEIASWWARADRAWARARARAGE
jgi:shikimate kinase